jgi:nicotinamide-nucleotide amidase
MVISRELLMLGEQVGERLKARGETVGVAESAAGGLIAAALLATPGASAYFRGGAVSYTGHARAGFLGLPATLTDLRPDTEPYAALLAKTVRERLETTWGIGETGAAGPTGSRYGDPPGHVCVAVSGPVERAATIRTNLDDRVANMEAFAAAALRLLLESIPTG